MGKEQKMKAITKDNAAPQVSTRGEQAASKVQRKDLIVSEEEIPFQSPVLPQEKTLLIPGMQILPFTQGHLPGSEKETPACMDACASVHPTDQYRPMKMATIEQLEILLKEDPKISINDTRAICDAINALDRALGCNS